jgi:hypothetical protein
VFAPVAADCFLKPASVRRHLKKQRWAIYSQSGKVFGDTRAISNARSSPKRLFSAYSINQPANRRVIMGNINSKDIKALVNAARENLGDILKEEAIDKISSSSPIEIDVKFELGVDDSASENYEALTQCYYICFTIGGRRYCYRYCY